MAKLQKEVEKEKQGNTSSLKNLFFKTSDLKEKLRNLKDRLRRDNLRFNRIKEYG